MTRRPAGALRVVLAGLVALVVALGGCSADGGTAAPAPTVTTTSTVGASPGAQGPEGFAAVTLVVTLPDGSVRELCVWLADTPALRSQGLMGVTDPALGGAAAMLFAFPADSTDGFWMKDTLLPLSIAWYAQDGSLVSTADMDPCPAGETACPVTAAGGRYRYAVEVAQGGLGALGLVDGSTIAVGAVCSPATPET